MNLTFGLALAAITLLPEAHKDNGELLIGIDGMKPYGSSERHIKAMKEAHIDMVECGTLTIEELDRLQKYGIGCYLYAALPYWWGGAWADKCPNGKMAEMRPLPVYAEQLAKVLRHPAIWGLEVGDEPCALDFAHYGKLLPFLKAKRPELGYYVCLYPNYATAWTADRPSGASQLGTKNYQEYIAAWCRNVPNASISTDIYPWGGTAKCGLMFENMRIVADAAQASGRTWDVVLQANRYQDTCGGETRTGRSMTANTMRFQANAALAYGAEFIWWGCWTKGWWTENVVDEQGRIDPRVYGMLKTVNGELKSLGREYVKFRRLSTELVGFGGTSLDDGNIRQPFVDAARSVAFADVKAADGAALAVGHMAAKDGSGKYAMLVAACDDPEDVKGTEHVVTFRTVAGRKACAFSSECAVALESAKDTQTFRIRSNRAVLVVAD